MRAPRTANPGPVNIGGEFGSPIGTTRTLGDLITVILGAAIAIAGVVALAIFIWGGYQILISAGKNDPQAAAKGRLAVTWGVAGFIIVVGAYWFIQIIEQVTGVNFITLPGFPDAESIGVILG